MTNTGVATVALVLTLTACSGGGGGSGNRSDQTFLRMATQDQRLATEDHSTLITLGHEACDLMDQYQGDTVQVDSTFVATGGKGGADFFTPSVMQDLRTAAATAYCPKYS